MIVPKKEQHNVCNWCGADVKDGIQYYKGKSHQIDYCDNYCEMKNQKMCEHNNKRTDSCTYSECFDCGKISQDSRL